MGFVRRRTGVVLPFETFVKNTKSDQSKRFERRYNLRPAKYCDIIYPMKDENKEIKIMSPLETASTKMTQWIGTPASLVVHTILFIGIFVLKAFGFPFDQILLILTTVVSLEAIYLAIFIQMTINRQEAKLHEVHEGLEELGEDVEEIGKDVDELSEDVEEIGKDVDELSEDVEEIGKDVDELGEDFEEISEDMEEDEKKEEQYRSQRNENLQKMETTLQSIIAELEKMKQQDTGRRATDK